MNIDRPVEARTIKEIFTSPMSHIADRAWSAMSERKRGYLLTSLQRQNSVALEPIADGETFIPLPSSPLMNFTFLKMMNLSATRRQRLIESVMRVSQHNIDDIQEATLLAQRLLHVQWQIYRNVLSRPDPVPTEEDFRRLDFVEKSYRNVVLEKKQSQQALIENEDIYQKLFLTEPDETPISELLLQCF